MIRPSLKYYKGIAMVNVLIIVAAISMMLVSIVETVKSNLVITEQVKYAARAALELRSAKNNILFTWLTEPINNFSLKSEFSAANLFNEPYEYSPGIIVRAQDQSGLLHAQYPDPAILRQLLLNYGLDDLDATALVDAIADWQDVDENTRNNGAEQNAYISGVLVRNGPVPSVADLIHVRGVTEKLNAFMLQNMSIYRMGFFNPLMSTRDLLESLYGYDIAEAVTISRSAGVINEQGFKTLTGFKEDMESSLFSSGIIKLSIVSKFNDAFASEQLLIRLRPHQLGNSPSVDLLWIKR